MRFELTEYLAEIGLGWGTAGMGALAVLVLSPKGRKRARSMLVSAIATGLAFTQQISQASSDLRREINQVVSEAQQTSTQPGAAAAFSGQPVQP